MNYEAKYNKALNKILEIYRDYDNVSNLIDVKKELEKIFPEIKEAKDERNWKQLKTIIHYNVPDNIFEYYNLDKEEFEYWIDKQIQNSKANDFETELNLLFEKYKDFSKDKILENLACYHDVIKQRYRLEKEQNNIKEEFDKPERDYNKS